MFGKSPKNRRSICNAPEAFKSGKEAKPRDSALEGAAAMGVRILTKKKDKSLYK
ncbi:DUF4256 domain-containing protein [bacterium]|nr:DUF4256 domain-containing protein [bacterium]